MNEREKLITELEARANALRQIIQAMRDNAMQLPSGPDQLTTRSWLTEKAERLQEVRERVLRELANARDLGEVKRI